MAVIAIKTAWAVGLFEGEGSIVFYRKGQTVLSRQMTDEDIVRRFHKVVKLGNVNGPYRNGRRKPTWKWTCCKAKDVSTLLRLWRPLLGSRRGAKATLAIKRTKPSAAYAKQHERGALSR